MSSNKNNEQSETESPSFPNKKIWAARVVNDFAALNIAKN